MKRGAASEQLQNFKPITMTNLETFIQKNPYKVFFIIIIICILADNF